VPTYEGIGIWGAVLLTILRFIQGVGVGGEWGGSVLMSMEWARDNHSRGFIASWPQFGVPCGLFLANLAVLAFSQMSGEQFLAWGWRVPFFLSLILVGVGLYIRLGIFETPVFAKLLAERKVERTPMLEVIKRHPKEIILSAFARMAEQAPFYIFTAFIFSYGIKNLQVSRDFLLTAVLVASVLSFFCIPFFGHLSDRIGRKKDVSCVGVRPRVQPNPAFQVGEVDNPGVCRGRRNQAHIIAVLNRSSVTRPDHAPRFAANCTWRRHHAKMAGVMV